MSMTWLADVDRETFWAHRPWPEFGAGVIGGAALAILPIYGFCDHGLGLPLDAEEILGSFVLKTAVASTQNREAIRVLPPLRFGLTPYPSGFFGIDPETMHDLVSEISECVRQAGFSKLAFFVTSPWNAEIVEVISCDVHVALELQTFVAPLSGFGLSFHPASEDRGKTQSAVAKLLGETPHRAAREAAVSDPSFRPGNFTWPASLPPGPPSDGVALALSAGEKLGGVLAEMARMSASAKLTPNRSDESWKNTAATGDAAGPVFPFGFRSRYLPAMHVAAWDKLNDKASAWVLIPTAAIEQHGRHLPVGVDALLGHAWVAETLACFPAGVRVYVAPPITYGKSNEHTGFPGTVSISAKTLRRLLLAIATQLKALGFRKIAVLNSHGGNTAVLTYTLREIQTTLGLRAGLLGQPYKPELSEQEAELGFHAGEWETSLMLGIASDLVQMDLAVSEYPLQRENLRSVRLDHGAANLSWKTSDISQSGVMGNAPAATLEKGQRWLKTGAAALAQKIADLSK